LPVLSIVMIVLLMGIALIVGLAVWVLSTLSRGALIAGASSVDAGSITNLREALAIAWRKGWTLLGIGVFPALPALIMLLAGLGAAGAYVGLSQQFAPGRMVPGPRNIWMIVAALACLILPLSLILNLLRTFANRACMLEGCGVFAAYARGFKVLVDNIVPALLLFLIQVGISIGLGLSLLLPTLCCALWPLLILVQGAAAAYFSTMWTLAWRQWVSEGPGTGGELVKGPSVPREVS
jgi:hypothetical protein